MKLAGEPSAVLAGPETEKWVAGPGRTVTGAEPVSVRDATEESIAVTSCGPSVSSVALKVPTPFTSVASAEYVLVASVEVMCTVPV